MTSNQEDRKLGFIINPIAGRGHRKAERIIQRYHQQFSRTSRIAFTKEQGHAALLAKDFIQSGFIPVAVGGDGTVNEVAQAAIGNDDAVMGIIPGGSGNGVARHLGINMNPSIALKQLHEGSISKIDTGLANKRPFIMLAGFGFDAVVALRMSKSKKRGLQAYASIVLAEWQRYKAREIHLLVDNEPYSFKNFFTTISNASQFGNNFYQAPKASMSDGLLDLSTITPFPVSVAPSIAIRMISKKIDRSPYKTGMQGRSILVETDSHVMNIDGESVAFDGQMEINVVPSSLNVIRPGDK